MSDSFYGQECLVRERARAIEREVRRQGVLALARKRHRRPFWGTRSKGVVAALVRFGRFLAGRIKDAAQGCGLGACR